MLFSYVTFLNRNYRQIIQLVAEIKLYLNNQFNPLIHYASLNFACGLEGKR